MREFKNFYLWSMNAKLYCGLYFMAISILVSIINFCFGIDSISFFTLLQIMGACIVIAFMQVLLLPDSTDFSRHIFFPKSLIWLVLSFAVISSASHFGNWFIDLPTWTSLLFAFVMTIAFGMMLLGLQFEQERDSIIINEQLEQYKSRK